MEAGQRNQPSWAFVATVIVFAQIVYVLSSGPMKIVFEKCRLRPATHSRVYAPLVWLIDNTPAERPLTCYWNMFQTEAERDYPLDRWIHSPKYRAINRGLGYE